jgi:hypothetical protein
MFTGWKVFGGSMLAVAVLLSTHAPAEAQPPQRESISVLEAQLALLKKMTAEVEEKLDKARAAEKKRPGGFDPFGGFGPKKGFGEGFGKEGFKKEGFGRNFGEKGRRDKKQAEPEKKTDREIQERLDRLTKEIEEIRRSLKK